MDLDPPQIKPWDATRDEAVYREMERSVGPEWRGEAQKGASHKVLLGLIMEQVGLGGHEPYRAREAFLRAPGFSDLLRTSALEGRSFMPVRDELARLIIIPDDTKMSGQKTIEPSRLNEGYEAIAAKSLREHVKNYWKRTSFFAKYLPIIQPSGWGKSRLIDELSKEHFTIPMNIRDPAAPGYSASDTALFNFFSALDEKTGPKLVLRHTNAFCFALLATCVARLKSEEAKAVRASGFSLAAWFREKMTANQIAAAHNRFRQEFYEDVLKKEDELFISHDCPSNPPTSRAEGSYNPSSQKVSYLAMLARQLTYEVAGKDWEMAVAKADQRDMYPPQLFLDFPNVILVFDEADDLYHRPAQFSSVARVASRVPGWTVCSQLCKSLRVFGSVHVLPLYHGNRPQLNEATRSPAGRRPGGAHSSLPPA